MTPEGSPADDLLRLAEAIRKQDSHLSPLAAGIAAALSMGLASDSRSFARIFGIAHALVLREINLMDQAGGPVTIRARDPRTQKIHLSLGEKYTTLWPELMSALDLGEGLAK